MRHFIVLAGVLIPLAAVCFGGEASIRSAVLDSCMPRVEDYTHMWWAEGFPAHTPSAPWVRCIRTGRYAMALDTQAMRILHMGAVADDADYLMAAKADDAIWRRLPPAEMELLIIVDGTSHRCSGGGKWANFSGPRIIDSGRFVQRADVTDLVFTAANGARLNIEARFETVAWPDRLGLILAARPRKAGTTQAGDGWQRASMEIRVGSNRQRWEMPAGENWRDWREVHAVPWPVQEAAPQMKIEAAELPSGAARAVEHDPARGWHRVNLDGIVPIVPPGPGERRNDAIERVKLILTNPLESEQTARLLFEKNGAGMRQSIGSAITGMSAVLRDPAGNPTGIPVQLSKNWHTRPEGGVYAGAWFHGFSQVRVPARSTVQLELTLAYGHWGGVAAASHAQLCLIGWGSNQLWDQSALGAWGESICYEPDQVQAHAAVLDVRPLMVASMSRNQQWSWTHNVGGADFFRLFDANGKRVFPAGMRTSYQRPGPCLTEVTYAGRTGAVAHVATVSLGRTDDIVRGVYRLRMDVKEPMEVSRLVVFQAGADTYSYTGERKLAIGSETGLIREWEARWGGDVYRTEPMECTGRTPWISMHEAVARREKTGEGAWANRGIVIRSWDARLGGKKSAPWVAERGVKARGADTSTVDIVPPPGVRQLEPGDYVEATIEHVVMPQFAKDYYGPDEALRTALGQWENTWRMIHREAAGNQRQVTMKVGTLEGLHPAVRVRTSDGQAEFTLAGGLGYVPVTFAGLPSHAGYAVSVDGQRVDQAVHGSDFCQTDYDPAGRRWEMTFNLKLDGSRPHVVRFERAVKE